ncbi:hypothetical protein TNIN_428711 [Trichonephila inaurata madagascariensis]|uniref:Uncharacterized protein n=1 Tax=Trichonephila inaurata madagascariensis TaxID=2747483 RepID=A0A8X7CTC6_9ARAC|nr:hypothetical protein TNIN_428711 [Trichonephila inaurata madagascariensis]
MQSSVLCQGHVRVWVADFCPASDACPMSGWQNCVLLRMHEHVKRQDGRTLSCRSSCPVAGLQISLLCQEYVQWPGDKTLFCFRVCPMSAWQSLSCVKLMCSFRVIELCPGSGACPLSLRQISVGSVRECPVSCRKNSVLLQGMDSIRVRTQFFQGHFQCPVVRNLSSVRVISVPGRQNSVPCWGRVQVVGWQNSVLRQGYVKCGWQNFVLPQGQVRDKVSELSPASRACSVARLQNFVPCRGHVQWPVF